MAAHILRIGTFDLSEYVRVNPTDSFDPADNDFLQPQFTDGGLGEGAAMISLNQDNRELAWPVHLTPTLDATWADTKDGLHQMVRDLNRALKAASSAEWRDDSATSSTFFDVVAARFEPDYNYRSSQKLWASGVVRVWTKPYAHTGTTRLIGTSSGTSVPAVLASGLGGDVPAKLDVTVSLAGAATGVIVGVAVRNAAAPFLVPAASITVPVAAAFGSPSALATRIGASGAIASQAIRMRGPGNSQTGYFLPTVALPSLPAGRHRLLALVRTSVPTIAP